MSVTPSSYDDTPVDLVDSDPDSPTFGTVIHLTQGAVDSLNRVLGSQFGLTARWHDDDSRDEVDDRATRIDELRRLVEKIRSTYESELGTYDALMVADQVISRIAKLEGRA